MKSLAEIRSAASAHKLLDRISRHKNWKIGETEFEYQLKPITKHRRDKGRDLPKGAKDLGHQEVPLHKVVSSQSSVSKQLVHFKIDNPDINLDGDSHPQMAYHKDEDKYELHDGNHRVAAHRLLGHKTIKAQVYGRK
jgi:hypothetical protein